MVEESDVPTVPNATYRQIGAFAQTELTLSDRLSVIVGGRWQNVRAETELTPGLEDEPVAKNSDGTFVGAANLLFKVTPELNLVAAVGRGFRAPNLVELFFNGATPEGSGFQVRNPELQAETSFNMEVGLKYRRQKVAFEGYLFRNQIRNGIRIGETGEMVGPFPAFQNVNIDKLRFQGYEVSGEYEPFAGLSFGLSYSALSSKDVLNPNNPIGDTYSSKLLTHASYRAPDGRFWASYRLRHSGEQKDTELVSNPIGDVLPGFTVHDLRGGIRLLDLGRTRHSLGISVENLTNELYAEFSNATFFRPQPKRTLLVSWITSF
jgi:outer membrane receptor protein involved in Fe transport